MFCHLVVEAATSSSASPSRRWQPWRHCHFFARFRFRSHWPRRSRLEHCQRNMHLTFMKGTPAGAKKQEPKEETQRQVEQGGRQEAGGCIYRVMQPVCCNWMATPATATSPRIALLLLSDWQQLALTILACQPPGSRRQAAEQPQPGVRTEQGAGRTARWQMNYVFERVQQVTNSLPHCRLHTYM